MKTRYALIVAATFAVLAIPSCGYATLTTNPDGSVTITPKPIVVPAK